MRPEEADKLNLLDKRQGEIDRYYFYKDEEDVVLLNKEEWLISQSIPQTEFDVIVEMENYELSDKYGNSVSCERPKLDADGCLILKRK